jgi:hypothetical protein
MATLTPSSLSCLHQEIQEYIRACEHLLSSSLSSEHTPLSAMERQVLEYYAEELHKHLLAPPCH